MKYNQYVNQRQNNLHIVQIPEHWEWKYVFNNWIYKGIRYYHYATVLSMQQTVLQNLPTFSKTYYLTETDHGLLPFWLLSCGSTCHGFSTNAFSNETENLYCSSSLAWQHNPFLKTFPPSGSSVMNSFQSYNLAVTISTFGQEKTLLILIN